MLGLLLPSAISNATEVSHVSWLQPARDHTLQCALLQGFSYLISYFCLVSFPFLIVQSFHTESLHSLPCLYCLPSGFTRYISCPSTHIPMNPMSKCFSTSLHVCLTSLKLYKSKSKLVLSPFCPKPTSSSSQSVVTIWFAQAKKPWSHPGASPSFCKQLTHCMPCWLCFHSRPTHQPLLASLMAFLLF